MYNAKLSKTVYKFIQHQTPKFRIIVFDALEKIAQDPFHNYLDIKKLKNMEHHYRLRLGKYRILFEIFKSDSLVYFYAADSRGDIYKG